MLKSFAAVAVLLCSAFVLIGLHASHFDHEGRNSRISAFSRLTTLPGVAFSKAYYEALPYDYGTSELNGYVEMPAIDSMDYVYAQ